MKSQPQKSAARCVVCPLLGFLYLFSQNTIVCSLSVNALQVNRPVIAGRFQKRQRSLSPICATEPNNQSPDFPSEKSAPEQTNELPIEISSVFPLNINEYSYIEHPPYEDGSKPESAFLLGTKNFIRQGSSIVDELLMRVGLTPKDYIPRSDRLPNVLGFTLDDQAVRDAERRRESRAGEKIESNPVARKLYEVGCFALDELFPGRPIARFWFLETIARMPYFSYVSMLHLYESFGWWRDPQLRKVHNAEEYNELHHLLIMEALGGNALWQDRFLGYHVAIGYYWLICGLFFFNPRAAYEFMALLEAHAVDTYTVFFQENKQKLKSLPAPSVATSYYTGADLYLFDDFQVSKKPKSRRPPCATLYDVFKNIAEDEGEHVKTMQACMDYSLVGDIVGKNFRMDQPENICSGYSWFLAFVKCSSSSRI